MKRLFAALLLFVIPGIHADDDDTHPLDSFFSAEVLPDEDAAEVMTHFELSERSPYHVEMEVYHTQLETKLLGALVNVSVEDLDLSYDLLIKFDALPYRREQGQAPLFRGEESARSEPVFTVREFRYEELPEIDDPSVESEEEEEEEEEEED